MGKGNAHCGMFGHTPDTRGNNPRDSTVGVESGALLPVLLDLVLFSSEVAEATEVFQRETSGDNVLRGCRFDAAATQDTLLNQVFLRAIPYISRMNFFRNHAGIKSEAIYIPIGCSSGCYNLSVPFRNAWSYLPEPHAPWSNDPSSLSRTTPQFSSSS